jgi:hypothetical protein
LAALFLLVLSYCECGREIECYYFDFSGDGVVWPTFTQCESTSDDLSETFKNVEHSFSGTAEQKSSATVVNFNSPTQVDFLPKEMFNDFPQLNGITIEYCKTFKTVKNNLFTEDFGAIQYLYLGENKIETIEANAFQHLPNLKWIGLNENELSSLPHQLFKNNPEMIVILLWRNKINSITPDFFKNLNKLRDVDFSSNQCANKKFGCESENCSVSQSELNSELSACYNNCLEDSECSSISGKQDVDNDEIKNRKNETQECDAKKFEEISQDLENLKVQHESLGNNFTLLIQAHDAELKSLKQELAYLKAKLEDRTSETVYLETKLGELFKKEFTDFVNQLNAGG